MKKNTIENLPDDLEAIGREAVESLGLKREMYLPPEMIQNITAAAGRKKFILRDTGIWSGVACACCAAFFAAVFLLPSLEVSDSLYRDSVFEDGNAYAVVEEYAMPEAAVAYGAPANGAVMMKAAAPATTAAPPGRRSLQRTAGEDTAVYSMSLRMDEAVNADMAAAYDRTDDIPVIDNAGYGMNVPGGFIDTRLEPFSTFSIDSDLGSFQYACGMLRANRRPAAEDIRIEQFVNSVEYLSYPEPEDDEVMNVFLTLADHPFRSNSKILRAAVQGSGRSSGLPGREREILLLCDTSGSMAINNAGTGAEIFRNEFLAAADSSIVEVKDISGSWYELDQVLGNCILNAEHKDISVILVSDMLWVPEAAEREILLEKIREYRNRGIRLNIVAFTAGGRKEYSGGGDISTGEWAEALTGAGGGVYLRASDGAEAAALLVSELDGKFEVIADDVKMQVEFNPACVVSYRLMGYERRLMAAEDFRNDQVRAAPLTAGGQVTAIYEIILADGAEAMHAASLTVRYREPGGIGFAERSATVNTAEEKDITDDEDLCAAGVIAEWAWGLKYGNSQETAGTDMLLRYLPGGSGGRFGEYAELIELSR